MSATRSASAEHERWLVIGGSGQVGRALLEVLPAASALATGRCGPGQQLDLCQLRLLPRRLDDLFTSFMPDVVVIAAGMTAVERCEEAPELADRVNHRAPALIARHAARHGARCVYLSSEYVFDGHRGPYDEEDQPRPLSVYGHSKLAGEHAVLEADPRSLLVRTTVVYGPEAAGKNFAYQLGDHLLRGTPMAVAADQVSTPTYNRDLARAMVAHVREPGSARTVHLSGPERLSRSAFARRLADGAGLDGSLIVALPTRQLHQRAPRPLDAGLVSRVASPAMRTAAEAVDDWRRLPSGRPWPTVLPSSPRKASASLAGAGFG